MYGSGGESVLDMQVGMNGGGPARSQAPMDDTTDFAEMIDATPRFVAGLVLGAALTILALRVAGFRFSFGASLGAGS